MPTQALLCDRDGTLVVDVPYNNDPEQLVPMVGVVGALARARRAAVRTGVVTNQSGVAKGIVSPAELEALHARLDALLGPFDVICACPHDETEGCTCRKPQPGLVLQAAETLGVPASACVVIGDTIADVEAADAAGALGILVPNVRTEAREVRAAPLVAWSFAEAVACALSPERWR